LTVRVSQHGKGWQARKKQRLVQYLHTRNNNDTAMCISAADVATRNAEIIDKSAPP
jgi:hypothetical protein